MSALEKKLLKKLRSAIMDFNMIKAWETVLLWGSWWKDSMVLWYLLNEYRKQVKDKFEIRWIYIFKEFLIKIGSDEQLINDVVALDEEILNEISELMADQRRLINIGYDDDYYEVKYNERILNLLNRKLTRYDNRISQLTDLRELLIRDLVPTPQSSMDEEDD